MKKVLSVILALILALTVLPTAFAEGEDNPYIIWSANDLDKIRDNLGGDYILAADIDLTGVSDFIPIGNENQPFTGTFDGNGHSISGLDMRYTYECEKGDEPLTLALFGCVDSGTVRNLNMSSVYIMSQVLGNKAANENQSAHAGGIVGILRNGSLVENCSVSGTIATIGYYNTYTRSGGISVSCVDSTIRNCLVDARPFSYGDYNNSMAGGITAWCTGSTISDCFVNGKMYSANTNGYCYAGGIVGSGEGTFNITGCVVATNDYTITGGDNYNGIPLTDAICAFGTLSGCAVTQSASQAILNRSAQVIADNSLGEESVYTSRGWDCENIWSVSEGSPALIHSVGSEFITETGEGTRIAYNNTKISFSEGILSIDGTDGIYNADSLLVTPVERFSQDALVIIIGENVPFIEEKAFENFENAEILVIKGNTRIGSSALSDAQKLSLVYFSASPDIEPSAFADNLTADVFTLDSKIYTGEIPQGAKTHTVRKDGGKLYISGELNIDAYLFFDLCSLLCGSYDGVSDVCIEKFICNNLQFFRYNKDSGFPEPIWDHTLTNADIRVKIPDGEEWHEITWNNFCELGLSDDIDNFKLTVTSDEYEEIEDAEIEIKDDDDEPTFFQRLLKFITSLFNRLFKIFSKAGQ